MEAGDLKFAVITAYKKNTVKVCKGEILEIISIINGDDACRFEVSGCSVEIISLCMLFDTELEAIEKTFEVIDDIKHGLEMDRAKQIHDFHVQYDLLEEQEKSLQHIKEILERV